MIPSSIGSTLLAGSAKSGLFTGAGHDCKKSVYQGREP
jgi:hypothetical protein